jgi:hypothetical protein
MNYQACSAQCASAPNQRRQQLRNIEHHAATETAPASVPNRRRPGKTHQVVVESPAVNDVPARFCTSAARMWCCHETTQLQVGAPQSGNIRPDRPGLRYFDFCVWS